LSGLFDAKARLPLWHLPQNFPAFISAIVNVVEPFFILNILE
jgi:hypothetical protein